VTITVGRGVVEVRDARSPLAPPVARLTPGLQLVHREGEEGSVVRKVSAEDAFSWRQGRLVYRSQPLVDVADDLNRTFTVPVRVEGPARSLRFSGVLVVDNQEAVVRRLEAFLPVQARRSDEAIILSSRP